MPANPVYELLPGTLKNLFFPPEKNEYTYFRYADAHPFLVGDEITKAAWAADASMLAYARYGQQRMAWSEVTAILTGAGLPNAVQIGDWQAPGTQAYFAWNDEFAILAFRGTEADDPSDSFADADIVMIHEPSYQLEAAHPVLAHLSLIEHLFGSARMVHQGFQRALNQVRDQVHSCVTAFRGNHPNAEICFTGHSLGAALALLAYSRFEDPMSRLITFGCPRVGNQPFRDRVIAFPSKGIFRCVNLNDPVAHVPLESFLYRHATDWFMHFDDEGVLNRQEAAAAFEGDVKTLEVTVSGLHWNGHTDLSQIQAPAGVVDHSPARYCMRIWNKVLSPA